MVEKYGDRYLVTRKLAVTLVSLAISACVLVGLITYYAAMAAMDRQIIPDPSTEPEPEPGSQAKEKVTDVRLPTHLIPELYTLQLVPFIIPDNFTIRGYVEIEMKCMEAANNVTLHVADMEIQNDTVILEEKISRKAIKITGHEYDKDREFYISNLAENLEAGKVYTIKIEYTAKLKDNLKGFYRSKYIDQSTGNEEYIAVTQFQATDARRAFPCFDEPAMKAKYKVSLGRLKNMKSISNMPIEREGEAMQGSAEYVWDRYMESVKMSTYLVAFVVSKFEYRETTREDNGVRFRIWSMPSSLDQTEYARDIGPKMLKFFEDYFQVKFPLPKQDMVAIPDFAAGAMENWGLITYRETALLFKEGVSAANNKQRIAIVVSHELAHQWFGNLVTPSWWTDLWLNEGFASYVEYLGVEETQPELKLLEQFVVYDLQDVFRIDALESSHPISIPVKHPDEISEIFDRISYGKGASIIRMMDKFLTTQTFRQGLTNYLTELQFDAATQDDLWRHLTVQGHKDGTLPVSMDVKTIMDTWTLQMGFPVLTVNRNYNSNSATVSQSRFLVTSSSSSKKTEKVGGPDYRWWVPLTFAPAGGDFNNTNTKSWMKKQEKSKQVEGMPDRDTAVVFNIQEVGYYRVNYDQRNWQLLAQQLDLDHRAIHVINRAQILDDALNLAKSGLLEYRTALSLTNFLSREDEYVPWAAALSGLSHLNKMLKRTAAYGEFKRYMLRLIDPIYTKLGFTEKPEDSHLDILLRKKAVSWACSMGNLDCLDQARSKFSSWMGMVEPDDEQQNPVSVNLKFETYCNAIADGGEKEWEFGWNRYTNSQVATEKSTMLSSLGCTKEVWLLNRFLNMSLTPDSGVRKQDGSTVIGSVARNTVGRYLALDFIQDQWPAVKNYYPSAFSLSGIIKNTLKDRNTGFELTELKSFAERYKSDLGSAERAVTQAIEGGEANIAWMVTNYEPIWDWLKEQNQASS